VIERILGAVADLVARRPGRVAWILALVTAGAIFGLTRFEIDSDYAAFLPDEIELDLDSRHVRALFVITTAQKLPGVRDALQASPYLESVLATKEELFAAAAARARKAPLFHLPPRSLERLERGLTTGRSEALLEMRDRLATDPLAGRELAIGDPLGVRWIFHDAQQQGLADVLDPSSPYLVSRDGETAVMLAYGKRAPFDVDFSNALLDDLESRTDAELIGGYHIARADAARMKRDLILSISMSIGLVLLYLWRAMGSVAAAHVLVLPTVCAIVWTLGYSALLLGPLNPLVVSAAAVLLGLGVDFAIHYATRYAEEGGDVRTTCQKTGALLLWSMLTGVAAFLTLLLLDFPGLRTFGLLLAVGLAAAYVATIFLLPLLLEAVPPTKGPGPVIRLFHRFSRTRAAGPAAAGLVLASLGGWLLVATNGLVIDADPRRFRPSNDPVAEAHLDFERRLGFSPQPITVLGYERDNLAGRVEQLERLGLIVASDGPHRLAPLRDVSAFRHATKGWLGAALADLKALGLNPGPFRPALEALDRKIRTDATVPEELWLFVPRSLWDADERAAFNAELKRTLGPAIEIRNPLTHADEVGPILRRELWKSFLLAGGAVLALVLVFHRSVQALLPAAIGFGLTLGALSILDIAIHPGNFVALPFLLGLGVDDGIHMAGRRREKSGDPLLTSGSAVWRTSATTLLAFGSLMTAATPAFSSLGSMLALGIASCFLASVVVLPAIWK